MPTDAPLNPASCDLPAAAKTTSNEGRTLAPSASAAPVQAPNAEMQRRLSATPRRTRLRASLRVSPAPALRASVNAGSVDARVQRHAGQQRVAAAHTREHDAPQVLRGIGEHVAGLGRVGDPGALGDLRVELSATPAGVTGEDPSALGCLGQLLDTRVRSGKADATEHHHARQRRLAEL